MNQDTFDTSNWNLWLVHSKHKSSRRVVAPTLEIAKNIYRVVAGVKLEQITSVEKAISTTGQEVADSNDIYEIVVERWQVVWLAEETEEHQVGDILKFNGQWYEKEEKVS